MVATDKTRIATRSRSRVPVDMNLPDQAGRKDRSPSHPDLVVLIPAYNEARFIGSVVLQARRFTNQVIVIDDGSTDNTTQIAHSAGARVVCHESNQGKGAALNTGFIAARQFDPKVLVCLDGDGQHQPDEIEQLIEPITTQQADIVVGSRYMDADHQVPTHRVWGHNLFNFLTHFASGVRSSDSQSGFRAFSARALQVISFCSQDFSVESEMQFLAQEYGLRVVEVPVTIRYLDPPKRSVIVHGLRVLNGFLRLVGQHRPLFYFGVPGIIIFGLGILLGLRVVEVFSRTSQLAAGSALLSILLSMVGVIMISTGFTLHSIRGLLSDMLTLRQKRKT